MAPDSETRARLGGGLLNGDRSKRLRLTLIRVVLVTAVVLVAGMPSAMSARSPDDVTMLTAEDFRYGTYIIDKPGTYMLAEDISFNPNSPDTLNQAVASGEIPPPMVSTLGLPSPVDAYHSGFPLFTQFAFGPSGPFTPGGPLEPRYDPAGFGIGFFAAIAVAADDVTIDLNGHTIQQSPEHALLMRFFAVIELADQPFVPGQGPFDFGGDIVSASNVTIKNGTIGLSSHHGIHGNGNENITIQNVDFIDYEVAAVALNGVKGLDVRNVTATNRKDVPVVGTFSSAQFLKAFIEELSRNGSPTTLEVDGVALDVEDIRQGLEAAINNTHADIIAQPNIVSGRAQIDPVEHPVEYALFHNKHGLLDGNSYSFLLNSLGVAVDGFPTRPDGITRVASEDVSFVNVHVRDQRAFINETPAIDIGGAAAIDAVGAVFQTLNAHPDTGGPVTVSNFDDTLARYTGNPVANAQAFVAKAKLNGEFDGSVLNVTRLNIPADVLAWVEGHPGSETLAEAGITYLCNGDSMFHVNKGVIGFKMDAATDVRLVNTSVRRIENLGVAGSDICGDYVEGKSHPKQTLNGYGGATVRGYTFSGSDSVRVIKARAADLSAYNGSAVGFAILTDSSDIRLANVAVERVDAGWGGPAPHGSPTKEAKAYGFAISPDASSIWVTGWCVADMSGLYGEVAVDDPAGAARTLANARNCGKR